MDSMSHNASRHGQAADEDKRNKRKFIVEEIPEFLRVYNDASVERLSTIVWEVPASCQDYNVGCKDVMINHQIGLWARLYIAQPHNPKHRTTRARMPLVFYFHGGGSCVGSTAWSTCHDFLCRFCLEANCMIISVNYRLPPEHRLPVAYDDCFSAIEWVRQKANDNIQTRRDRVADSPACNDELWVRTYADISRCFLAGVSAGGNIVHHVAVRFAASDLKQLCVRGDILIQPFFGREYGGRTKSEVESTDPALPLRWTDVFWKLCLPVGANKDHPACNPLGINGRGDQTSNGLRELSLPSLLLLIAEGDVLRDIDLEY